MFSSGICEIIENNFFYRTPPVTTSGILMLPFIYMLLIAASDEMFLNKKGVGVEWNSTLVPRNGLVKKTCKKN